MKFEMFRQGQDGPFSFSLVDDQGNELLTSGEYASQEACTDAIRQTIESFREPARFQTNGETGAFQVVDSNGNILVQSDTYDEAEAREQLIASIQQEAEVNAEFEVSFTTTRRRARVVPVGEVDFASFYDFSQSSHSGNSGFDPYQNESDEQFYFLFNGADGTPILFSRSFPTIGRRDGRIRLVIKESPKAARYERMEVDGQPFFILKASNGTEIARSKPFSTEADMEGAIAYLMAEAPTFAAQYPAPAKRTRGVNEYDLTQPSTSGEKGFESFRSEKNQQYYFHFNDDQGAALLFSEGYSSSRSRNNGIRSVIKNSPIRERYEVKQDGDLHYVSLKAGNRQEIARTRNLGSQADAEAMIPFLMGQLPTYAEAYKVVFEPETETSTFTLNMGTAARGLGEAPEETGGTTDDYNLAQASTSGSAGFERFVSDINNEAYFHFNDADGNALFYSEGYSTERSRDNGVRSVIKNSVVEERFEMKEDANGPYFILRAGNRQEIGRSRYFADEAERDIYLGYFQRHAHLEAGDFEVEVEVPEHLQPQLVGRGIDGVGTTDDYDLTQASTSGVAGFERFVSDKNQEAYFHVNDADGKALFYSEGYSNERSRDNGVRSVIRNSVVAERFEMKEDEHGHYFILRAGNRQEIGRSRYFTNPEERDEQLAYFQRHVHLEAGDFDVEVEVPAHLQPQVSGRGLEGEGSTDDYDLTQVSTSGIAGFERFISDTNQEAYFHFNDADGHALLYSEGYSTEPSRDNGIQSVIKNSVLAERFEMKQDEQGYFFVLRAGNRQEIGRSRYFADADEANAMLTYFQQHAHLEAEDFDVEVEVPESLKLGSAGRGATEDSLGKVDNYYLNQPGGSTEPGFDLFFSPTLGGHYFHFNDQDGNPILFSESYTSEDGRDSGIRATIRNGILTERFLFREDEQGYYYIIRSANNHEVARSRYYPTKGAAEAAVMDLRMRLPRYASAYGVELAPTDLPADLNPQYGYLPWSTYPRAQVSNSFDTYQDPDTGLYYWAYLDDNGEPMFISQGFATEAERDEHIKTAIGAMGNGDRYELVEGPTGWYYRLVDSNGQPIALTRPYASQEEANGRLNWMMNSMPALAWAGSYYDWSTGEVGVEAEPVPADPGPKNGYEPEPSVDPEAELGPENAYASYVNLGNYESQLTPGQTGYDTYYDEETGQYYWVYLDDTHRPFLVSQGYGTEAERDASLIACMEHVGYEDRYRLMQAPEGYYYYDLHDENGEVVARTRPFSDKEKAKDKLGWLFAALPLFAWGGYRWDWDARTREYEAPYTPPVDPEPLPPEPEPEPTPVPPVTTYPEPTPEPEKPQPVAEEEPRRGWPWWLWLLLFALLLLLAWLFWSQCNRDKTPVVEPPTTVQPEPPTDGGSGTYPENEGNIPVLPTDSLDTDSTDTSDPDKGGKDDKGGDDGKGDDNGTPDTNQGKANQGGKAGQGGNTGADKSNDNTKPGTGGEGARRGQSEEVKAMGPTAPELGLTKKSYPGILATYLSDPNSNFPSAPFVLPGENFSFDGHYLQQPARRIIMSPNKVSKVLKAYPNAVIDIIGYRHQSEQAMVPDVYENPQPGGTIDLALLRARCLYRKLNAVGIPYSRMNMLTRVVTDGPANASSRRVELVIRNR